MNRNKVSLLQARALHEAGKFEEAKKAYLTLLKTNPRSVEILDWLGILHVQEEEYSSAIGYFQKAVDLQPKNPVLNLHLANVLKIEGLFSQAASILEKLLSVNPNYVPALNNLATVYHSQEKYDEAVQYFNKAIQLQPNFVDAFYNLGVTLLKKNQFTEAGNQFKKILELSPNHFPAKYQLAVSLMSQEKNQEAIKIFLEIEETYPHHFETQTNLATSFLKIGLLNEAKNHYLSAAELQPDDLQIMYNLAVINTQLGNVDTAIQQYQKIVLQNPNDFAAHNNLGVLFLAKQHVPYALQHFQEALRIQPNNKAVAHSVNILTEKQHLLEAPPEYIKSLFDAYADHYDTHLVTALDYQVPRLFSEMLAKKLKDHIDILDLGCGTGLTARPFKVYAKTLIGIDLSEKMLEMAAQKNLFTELVNSDVNHFLEATHKQFDLVIAGDVVVYMGDLILFFKNISRVLRSGSFFIFNAEITEETNFKMNQSGRFAHRKDYLEKLALDNHFKIAKYEMAVTRLQNNEAVFGHVFLLEKT